MGHLDGVLVDGHQARVGEPLQHPVGSRRVGRARQLAQIHPAAGVLGAVTELGQTQEQLAGPCLLGLVEARYTASAVWAMAPRTPPAAR